MKIMHSKIIRKNCLSCVFKNTHWKGSTKEICCGVVLVTDNVSAWNKDRTTYGTADGGTGCIPGL